MIRTHYEACKILGVKSNDTPDKWKSAYRNICKLYHPDNNNNDNTAAYIALAKEALDFLLNEKSVIINNDIKPVSNNRKSCIYGGNNKYQYNHNDYKKFQKRLNEKAKEDKAAKVMELKVANDKIRELERQKKEKELLDKIRWIRIADIIKRTIEEDKKGINDDNR